MPASAIQSSVRVRKRAPPATSSAQRVQATGLSVPGGSTTRAYVPACDGRRGVERDVHRGGLGRERDGLLGHDRAGHQRAVAGGDRARQLDAGLAGGGVADDRLQRVDHAGLVEHEDLRQRLGRGDRDRRRSRGCAGRIPGGLGAGSEHERREDRGAAGLNGSPQLLQSMIDSPELARPPAEEVIRVPSRRCAGGPRRRPRWPRTRRRKPRS